MNSGNHVMLLGDLVIWFYENLAGIRNDPQSAGFKKILMQPVFIDGLDYVKASYNSVSGRSRAIGNVKMVKSSGRSPFRPILLQPLI